MRPSQHSNHFTHNWKENQEVQSLYFVGQMAGIMFGFGCILVFFWFDYLGFYIWLLWLGMMSIVAMVWYMMQLDKKNEDNPKYQDSLQNQDDLKKKDDLKNEDSLEK